ncbi:MAG: 4Fe-4S dicluster domain-containing protein [Steroidobacteraceae bacterium]|nr:4Fe-4S dicluster domain-containing protein [Deltaproteobacteria bacterium]
MEALPENDPIPPVRLYRINAGSCNGCDVELATTASVARFDVERWGCRYSESPADADIVLITGPLTVRVRDKVLRLYGEVSEPKVTVAVGVCPISGGVFRDSYAVVGPIDRYLPVDINVPGCPPHPRALGAGIAKAATLWRERCGYTQPSPELASPGNYDGDAVAPTGLRGKMRFNAAACVGCRMCEHVCAGGAIRFDETDTGLHFTLWHNSCAFCGLCSHYCPTKALSVTDEWQMSHLQEDKYRLVEQGVVSFVPCTDCGSILLPVAPELLRVAYRETSREIERLKTLCPECRQKQSIGGIRR